MGGIKVPAEKIVPLPSCTSQFPHGTPTDRTGLKIRPENDEAGSGLSQNGEVRPRHWPDNTGKPPRFDLATRGTNVSYFNPECDWAHVGYINIGLKAGYW